MVLRSRLLQWITAFGVFVVLAGGLTAVIVRSGEEEDHPAEWDARVLDLVHFVERERGAVFDHPVPVDFLTPAEYSERTRTEEGALSDEERAELEQFEGALRALGILSADTDLLEASNDLADSGTLAYYDPQEERVVVRGTSVTPSLAVTLVHELTHVLQDQVFDLGRFEFDPEAEDGDEPTSGEAYAFDALVEGDADRIEHLYVEQLDEDTQVAIEEENADGLDEFEASGIPVALSSLFGSLYGLGDAFVAMIEAADGESVDEAFAHPPISEEQVFDPFEYLDGDGPDVVRSPGTDGEEAFDEGDFGAVSLLVVLAERIDPLQALAAATGWGGDAFTMFPRDDRTCFRLNVTGDTDDDTDELEDALAAWVDAVEGDRASTERSGDIVFFESCDGKRDQGEGTGGSRDAVELAVARSFVAAGALEEGADTDQARCFGSALVNGLTLDELSSDELSPALEQRVAGLAAGCR